MNHLLKMLLVLLPGTAVSQSFRLSPPRIYVESRFFTDSLKVRFGFEMEGSSVFYKLDGKNSSNGLKIKALNPRSFTAVKGTTSRSPWSGSPIKICQSTGIVILYEPICNTNAGLLKLSRKIKGMKKKSGSL